MWLARTIRVVVVLATLLLPSWLGTGAAQAAGMPTMLGVNMLDLMLQYTGTASSQTGSASAQAAQIAVARKRLADAADQGFTMARVGVMGWGPDAPQDVAVPTANNLTLWLANPDQFWADMDLMFADLDANHIRLVPVFMWNEHQIPTLAGEKVTDLIQWPLKSRALLTNFLTQFIGRYKARNTILFYELFNELNLNADLDSVSWCQQNVYKTQPERCASYGNFSSIDLTSFATNLVRQIKAMDGTRKISSGYTFPRPYAWHLQQGFVSGNFANAFVPDTYAEWASYMSMIHAPFDIASAHVYPNASDRWFGRDTSQTPLQIDDLTNFAHQNGKLAYIGEFGDTNSSGASPWLQDVTTRMRTDNTDFATIWTWEWYQFDPYTRAAEPNYEPGFTDAADSFFRQLTGAAAPSPTLRVVLSWPQPCDMVQHGWQDLGYALASGSAGVDSVTFTLNGTVIATVSAPPYRVTLPSLPAGTYTLTATASSGAQTAAYSTTFGYGQAATGCVIPAPADALPTVVATAPVALTQRAQVATVGALRGAARARPASPAQPAVAPSLVSAPAMTVAATPVTATPVVANQVVANQVVANQVVANQVVASQVVANQVVANQVAAIAVQVVPVVADAAVGAATSATDQPVLASQAAAPPVTAPLPAVVQAATPMTVFAVAGGGACHDRGMPGADRSGCAAPLGGTPRLTGVRWTSVSLN